MRTQVLLSGLLLASVSLVGCEDALKDVASPNQAGTQDARKVPEPNLLYRAVNIDLQRVEVSQDADANTDNWATLTDVQPGARDLLTTGSTYSPLFITSGFQSGTVKQLRLVLGTNSTITLANGRVVELDTPSGQTSGLKVKVNARVVGNSRYSVLVTIDPYSQIVSRGNGTYGLKPVLDGSVVSAWGGDSEAKAYTPSSIASGRAE